MLSQIDFIVAQVNDLSGVVEDLKSKVVETDKMDETGTLDYVQSGQYQYQFINIILYSARLNFQFPYTKGKIIWFVSLFFWSLAVIDKILPK